MENDQYFASLSSSLEDDDIEFEGKLLHQACLWDNSELVSDLLFSDGEKHINTQDRNGRTALHAAVISNSVKCARLLLMNGANPNVVQTRFSETHPCYKTCLHIASERGSPQMVATLVEFGANAFIKDENGFTAMDLAEKEQFPNVVDILRTCIAERERERLELYEELAMAVHSGQTSGVEVLLEKVKTFASNGADIDEEICLLINWAPNGSNTLLFKACQEGHSEIVSLLIATGADGRQHPVTKYSPLYIASYHGRLKIVKLLLGHFPELVAVFTVEHWLPIHAAAMNNHLEIVSLLLNFHYPINVQKSFICVCDNAQKLGDELNDSILGDTSELDAKLAGSSSKLSRRQSMKKVSNLVEKCYVYLMPFDVNAQDIAGQSVLYMATLLGNLPLAEMLLNFRTRALAYEKSSAETDSGVHNRSVIGTDLEWAFTKKLSNQSDEMLMSPDSEVSSISMDDFEQESSSSNDVTVISNLDKSRSSAHGSSQASDSGSRSLMQKLLDKLSPSSSPAQNERLEVLMQKQNRCASKSPNQKAANMAITKPSPEPPEGMKSLKRTGTVTSAFYTVNPLNIDLYCNYGNETALHCAVRARHLSIVSLFLERGGNCNLPMNNNSALEQHGLGGSDGRTPIVTRISHFNHNLFQPLGSQRRLSLTPKPLPLPGNSIPSTQSQTNIQEDAKYGANCHANSQASDGKLSNVLNGSKTRQTQQRRDSLTVVDGGDGHKSSLQNNAEIRDTDSELFLSGRSVRRSRVRSNALREAIRNRDSSMVNLLFRFGALDQLNENDEDDDDDDDDEDDDDNSDEQRDDYQSKIASKLNNQPDNHVINPEADGPGLYSVRREFIVKKPTARMNGLEIAFTNGDMHFVTKLLSIRAFTDSEGRINKRAFERLGIGAIVSPMGANSAPGAGNSPMDSACATSSGTLFDTRKPFNCTFGNTVTMSCLFPATPVMIDWRRLKIRNLEQYLVKHLTQWLIDSALVFNQKLKSDSSVSLSYSNALAAITRIDLSENALTSVPLCLFNQLSSLKILNLSKNRLQTLPETEYRRIVDDELVLKCRQNSDNSPELAIVSGDREAKKVRLFSRMKKSQSVTSSLTSGGAGAVHGIHGTQSSRLKQFQESVGWNLPALEELYLQDNCLECLPISLFQQPQMKILDLSNNKLRTLPPQFWYSPKLSELNLSLNLLCELPSPISGVSSEETNDHGSSLRSRTCSPAGRIPKSISISSISDSMQRTGSVSSIQSLDSLDDFRTDGAIRARRVNLKPFEINLKKPWTGQVAVNLDAAGEPAAFGSTFGLFGADKNEPEQFETKSGSGRRNSTQTGLGNKGSVVNKRKICVLTQLNLSHNGFERVPFLLSCIGNRLTHLNMSYNRIRSVFDSEHFLGQYPVTLKHLDLSHNCIDEWILPQQTTNVRKGNNQNLSLFDSSDDVFGSMESVAQDSNRVCCHSDPKLCPFKKHIRLDQLKTLILSQNQLKSIVITKEELFDLVDRLSSSLKPLKVGSLTLSNFTETVFRKGFTRKFAIFGSQDDLFSAAGGSGQNNGSNSGTPESGMLAGAEQTEMMLSAKAIRYSKLFFPNISMIDLSSNHICDIPKSIAYLSQLSVLNLSNNLELIQLPPEMGLLSKLWNLNTRGCINLNEPIRSMIISKTYKTADIISYLNSILENSKPYARMKLMLVGVQGIGKTSLMEQLRGEGVGRRVGRSADHWGKRMGSKSMGIKTPKGVTLSTVGVDLCEWVYERKPLRGREVRERSLSRTRMPAFQAAPSHFQGVVNNDRLGPVTFRTWDFGGQQEYYGTHQYFLSKRSIYLVVWKITDGEKGVAGLNQWLVNIQSRAPGSPVIIVGTHYDLVKEYYPPFFSSDLQASIRQKYMSLTVDADKRGLPKVVASVEVSAKSKFNIRLLANLIYETAWELKLPGSKERLLDQKVPATYLALEEIVSDLSHHRLQAGLEPVLSGEQFKTEVVKGMKERGMHFRDLCELQQATKFLHENGVLLHYDDANLKDLFFLDPQWLADMLAHVVTIREINPFARCGIMRMDNLLALFKNSISAPVDVKQFMLSLLNKFELALTWDNRTMLVPSLLPSEEQLLNGFPGSEILVPIKTREKIRFTPTKLSAITNNLTFENSILFGELKSLLDCSSANISQAKFKVNEDGFFENEPTQAKSDKSHRKVGEDGKEKKCVELENSTKFEPSAKITAQKSGRHPIQRLLLLSYVPCGFWSRLITRIVADESIAEIVKAYFIPQNVAVGDAKSLQKPFHKRETVSSSISEDLEGILHSNNADCQAHWHCWQTGFGLRYFGTFLLRVKEVALSKDESKTENTTLPLSSISGLKQTPNDYRKMKFFVNSHADTVSLTSDNSEATKAKWTELELSQQGSALIEILLPNQWLQIDSTIPEVENDEQDENSVTILERRHILEPNFEALTKLLVLIVEHIDTLLEDWYPALGTRFIHTSDGRFLVSRLVPCFSCLGSLQDDVSSDRSGKASIQKPRSRIIKSPSTEGIDVHLTDFYKQEVKKAELEASESIDLKHESTDSAICVKSSNSLSPEINGVESGKEAEVLLSLFDNVYTFMVEECILAVYEDRKLQCPQHGCMKISQLAPDVLFADLPSRFCVDRERLRFGKLLGRGSFGFVFRAFMAHKPLTGSDLAPNRMVANSKFYLPLAEEQVVDGTDVALKLLQPIKLENLTTGLKKADMEAYNAMKSKWERDPLQYACKAYCTARTELQILTTLKHPYIASILGLCPRPLALVLTLAPLGSLDTHVKQFRRSGTRIPVQNLQQAYLQVSKALEYLHQHHIIYRDLKSENVLVWSFPNPTSCLGSVPILLKLTDYGISRSALPTGTKGFGGTEGFMAPEIMLYNGEEEYTEKVDCFSFAMFMYELATLRFPFEGQEFAIRENILDGIRPPLSQHDIDHLPESFVDLIVRCWAQQPADRPSVSQIVSIISAPEFCSLRDVAILTQDCKVICAMAFADDCFDTETEDESASYEDGLYDDYENISDEEDDIQEDVEKRNLTLVLSRIGQQIDIVESKNQRWSHIGHTLECSNIAGRTILSMVIVAGRELWLGDSQSRIHVHSLTEDFRLICMIDLISQQNQSTLHALGIKSLISCDRFCIVWADHLWLISLSKLSELLTKSEKQCFTLDELGSISLDFNGSPIHCVASISGDSHLPESSKRTTTEIWFGQAEGKLSIVQVHEQASSPGSVQILNRTLLDHYEQKSIRKGLSTPLIGPEIPLQDRLNCALLAAVPAVSTSPSAQNFCASVLFNGCVIYQFDTARKLIVHRLDCSKLVPCSESLCTFGFEDHFKPGSCQITALSVNGSELYVGTNTGSIIVIESSSLTPIIVFRPHNQEVKFIVTLQSYIPPRKNKNQHRKPDNFDSKRTPQSPNRIEESPKSSPEKSTGKSKSPLKSFDFWKPFGLKSPSKGLPPMVPVQKSKSSKSDKHKQLQIDEKQKSDKRKPFIIEKPIQKDLKTNTRLPFVSIGRGQRNLLDRFIGNGQKINDENDSLVAMLWQSSDWN